jgi:hypothetical protein
MSTGRDEYEYAWGPPTQSHTHDSYGFMSRGAAVSAQGKARQGMALPYALPCLASMPCLALPLVSAPGLLYFTFIYLLTYLLTYLLRTFTVRRERTWPKRTVSGRTCHDAQLAGGTLTYMHPPR